ncbi:MAG TPA: hypothetical protein VGM76_02150 [Lacipirellulaceae bacterium]|jgi:hypothetical protein
MTSQHLADLVRDFCDVKDWDDDAAIIGAYASAGGRPLFPDPAKLEQVIAQCESLGDFDLAIDGALRYA